MVLFPKRRTRISYSYVVRLSTPRILPLNKGLILNVVIKSRRLLNTDKNVALQTLLVKVAQECREWDPFECHLVDDRALVPREKFTVTQVTPGDVRPHSIFHRYTDKANSVQRFAELT